MTTDVSLCRLKRTCRRRKRCKSWQQRSLNYRRKRNAKARGRYRRFRTSHSVGEKSPYMSWTSFIVLHVISISHSFLYDIWVFGVSYFRHKVSRESREMCDANTGHTEAGFIQGRREETGGGPGELTSRYICLL